MCMKFDQKFLSFHSIFRETGIIFFIIFSFKIEISQTKNCQREKKLSCVAIDGFNYDTWKLFG